MVWSDIFTTLCPGGYQDSRPKALEHDHVNRQRGLSGEQLRQDQAGHQRHQHHNVSPEHHGQIGDSLSQRWRTPVHLSCTHTPSLQATVHTRSPDEPTAGVASNPKEPLFVFKSTK